MAWYQRACPGTEVPNEVKHGPAHRCPIPEKIDLNDELYDSLHSVLYIYIFLPYVCTHIYKIKD